MKKVIFLCSAAGLYLFFNPPPISRVDAVLARDDSGLPMPGYDMAELCPNKGACTERAMRNTVQALWQQTSVRVRNTCILRQESKDPEPYTSLLACMECGAP
jgi:hypothetical protein